MKFTMKNCVIVVPDYIENANGVKECVVANQYRRYVEQFAISALSRGVLQMNCGYTLFFVDIGWNDEMRTEWDLSENTKYEIHVPALREKVQDAITHAGRVHEKQLLGALALPLRKHSLECN